MATLIGFIWSAGSSIQSDWSCKHYLHKHRPPENTSKVPQEGPVHFEVRFTRQQSTQLGAEVDQPDDSWRVVITVLVIVHLAPPHQKYGSPAKATLECYCKSWSWTVLMGRRHRLFSRFKYLFYLTKATLLECHCKSWSWTVLMGPVVIVFFCWIVKIAY
jgi:hypothetical protein